MENVAVHAGQPGAEAAPAQEPPKENTQEQPKDGGAPTVSTPETTPAKTGICTQVCDYVAENWKPMLVGAAAGAVITAGAVWAFSGSKEAPVVI